MKDNMKKIFKVSILFAFLSIIVVGLISFSLIYSAYKSLPDVGKLVESYTPSVPTIIFDSNDEVIDSIYRERRDTATISEIPENVKNAFVAIEDRRFYTHHGLDPLRLGRAIAVNISQGRAAQGASTITQQLAKNAFLTHEKKLTRKVKEALITLEIERSYTKDEILEKYLNEIYFGAGSYGIKTAARSFFEKDVEDLNLAEGAMLAGMPNRPSLYNPRKNLEQSLRRTKLILNQMKKFNYITEDEYNRALKQKFLLEKDLPENYIADDYTSVIKEKNSRKSLNSPDFTDIVEKRIFEMFDENTIYEGGLKVYTSLDLQMQKAAIETFNNYKLLKEDPKLQGALITIDSNNGYVKSIIAGKNFKTGNFNRATMAKRQVGSSFKPFVYFTALKKGIPMNAVVEDSEIEYKDWKPQNYGGYFSGNITVLQAMEKSVNIVAIKLLEKVGVKSVINTFRKTGVDVDIPYNLSIALGTMSMSPLDLATAYIPFSNGGYKVKPIFISKVLDRYGNVLYESPVEKEKIFASDNVSLIVHMMKNVVANGSGRRARVTDKDGNFVEQGGKTGTTNDYRSAWFAGITPEYVTTLYIGYDDNSPMKKATGGGAAAPLWGEYYQAMINKDAYTPGEFQFMEDHIENGNLITANIDSKTGLLGDSSSISIRKGLFKRGQVPVENNSSYSKGLESFFIGDVTLTDELSADELNEIKNHPDLEEEKIISSDLF
ncbi:transglycosylase domain-containing protein [Ilyobacter polytropus]|uniref:Penicillin-binding protein, 1A family n=1 Tax=Ilyobacter polytropus (strain ATCC 51220 / DSM 2926 / LMG 16218 / CuHBu1) TaxID=572544 RepID=E3H7A1_ILYPC|nr:PBP1A family penicillin-binding protein [Ilyobacter polytropus]ADO82582.1 penicillin-binding protein, 1A family [Ilyobacter polytropus DSM 2926]